MVYAGVMEVLEVGYGITFVYRDEGVNRLLKNVWIVGFFL
jgi:hypothetical protein